MANKKKKFEPEEELGAPEWMVTFSDCMTLLLTFFVLLLSFSSFDDAAFSQVQNAFAIGMPDSSTFSGGASTSLAEVKNIKKVQDIPDGSKTPTPSDKALGNLSKKKRLTDYQRQKVFRIPSEEIFAGNASVINPKNKEVLGYMTAFLKAQPSRVVICEFDPENPEKSDAKSIQRAWVVMKYFVDSNVEADRFSITGSTMLSRDDNLKKRQVVITLLEEGVY